MRYKEANIHQRHSASSLCYLELLSNVMDDIGEVAARSVWCAHMVFVDLCASRYEEENPSTCEIASILEIVAAVVSPCRIVITRSAISMSMS